MKEKKDAAEKIENFQAEVPMEEYGKECTATIDFITAGLRHGAGALPSGAGGGWVCGLRHAGHRP